ncbi:M20 family metallopeptidase [Halosimplex sp. TS25]|uniref:M20 family metallopeptidase n=1 Tax=Halosimplex rarum TaxID=3396619 RepID=UPI0039E7F8DD
MDVADVARDLVSIPSHEREETAGDFIEEWLREHTDAAVTRDDAGAEAGRGGNVVARKGTGETSLALVGHHDVVPPDESQVTDDGGYVVRESAGRLRGRGSADMKGAVAAALCAFRDADLPDGVELIFASFVGEEVGGVGARAAIDRGFAPDYAVVGEGSTGYSAPGVTDVAVAHKGRRGSTLVAKGRASHASEPESGANAIYRASDAIDVVRDLEFPESEVMGHQLSGSVAVTEIEGGSAWNVIPERCEVTVDERTVPGERAPLERTESIDGVAWTVDQDLPPMACDDPEFADAVLSAARDAQAAQGVDAPGDGEPAHVVKPHATDAGWLADAGTTCVVCGPAEPGEAHTASESVSLAVLDRCYEIYRAVAESWSG